MMNNYNRSRMDQRQSCSLCQQNRCAERRYNNMNMNARADIPNQSGGCGCNDHGGELLHKLQTIDFSIYELVLYLDAYPDCEEALSMYNQLLTQRCEVVAEYERKS